MQNLTGGKMAGKFEIYKDKAGEFRFRLKAGNGEVIAVSEGYKSEQGARDGIESVKKNAPEAKIVEIEK
jgi:uncharacterized protein